jgi:hypothetical protein
MGDTPGVIGTVTVVLAEGGKIGVQTTGGLSQLTALGLLEAGKHIVITSTAKEKSMIAPGTGIPDSMLRRRPGT